MQGFLSIKIPTKMRGFLPWKTWKRQWISIRRSPFGGIELFIGRNSQNFLYISPSDIIVRTQSRSHLYAFGIYPREGSTANFCLAGTSETESQKWISAMRKLLRSPLLPAEMDEFTVSVIDNSFTRSSGFPGLYGILRVTASGLTIIDQFTSKTTAHWLWSQMSHVYLATTVSEEDKERICTIITSSEFPTGIGKIHLFCVDAASLIRELTKGRSSNFARFLQRTKTGRHHTISCGTRERNYKSPNPPKRISLSDPVKLERRLSKSESNLQSLIYQLDNSSECSDSGFSHDVYTSFLPDNEDRDSPEGMPIPREVSWSSSEWCRHRESNHVYQELSNDLIIDEVASAFDKARLSKFSPRRESGVSVASGLYEEIDQFCFNCGHNTVDEDSSIDPQPPPLPPRRESFQRRLKRSLYVKPTTLQIPDCPEKYISLSAGSTPLPSPPSLSRTHSSAEFNSWQEESHYIPMNQCSGYLRSETKPDDPVYVVMSGSKKDDT